MARNPDLSRAAAETKDLITSLPVLSKKFFPRRPSYRALQDARQKRIAHRIEQDLIGQAGLAHYFTRVVDMELQCRE